MALTPQVLFDARIYLQTADLTGFSNKVELTPTAADEDWTNFASGGWKQRVGGLFDTSVNLEGFFQATDVSNPDDMFWANLGGSQVALTVAPTSGASGALTYLTRVAVLDYKPAAAIGKVLGWQATTKGTRPLVRGTILHPQGTARTTSGSGTGFQLGAVAAGQAMYANLHTLSVSGTGSPSLAVILQSSVDNTFAAPTTRITFATDTAMDGQALSVLGPITDQWWRVSWTITGVSPSFLFAAAAGIGPKS